MSRTAWVCLTLLTLVTAALAMAAVLGAFQPR